MAGIGDVNELSVRQRVGSRQIADPALDVGVGPQYERRARDVGEDLPQRLGVAFECVLRDLQTAPAAGDREASRPVGIELLVVVRNRPLN